MKLPLKISLFFLPIFTFNSCSNDDFNTKEIISIPDPQFEELLIEQGIDSDNTLNGEILKSDAEKTIILDLNKTIKSKKIKDLSGIESFTNITFLSAAYQKIASVNLSANKKLDTIYLLGNNIEEIDFTHNTNLILINIQANKLHTVTGISKVTKLKELDVSWNNLTTFDVQNSSVIRLYIMHNLLTQLNLKEAINIQNIVSQSNQLTSLDIDTNTKLRTLLTSDNKISGINLKNNISLTHLYISSNLLTDIDVSKNTNLTELNVDRNPNLTCIKKGVDQNIPYLSLSDYQTIGSDCN